MHVTPPIYHYQYIGKAGLRQSFTKSKNSSLKAKEVRFLGKI